MDHNQPDPSQDEGQRLVEETAPNNQRQQQQQQRSNNKSTTTLQQQQQAIMSSSSVWVQLYYKGKDEPEGQPIKIKPAPEDVADLKELLKTEKAKKTLEHCDALKLRVFPPGTKAPFLQDKAIDAGDDVPSVTTSKNPLIVVAPQQQADGDDRELQDKLRFGGWYLVSGSLERDKNAGGVRSQLVQLAKGGYYKDGQNIEAAFLAELHPDKSKPNSRLISISIVYTVEDKADNFIAEVDSYVVSTRGLSWYSGLQKDSIAPFADKKLILRSHYVAREEDGEPPDDSLVWDVELGSIQMSSMASTYEKDDPVYKYQRIEKDIAFSRGKPDGAHIFPKAKCKGVYAWLDKEHFNRLALSKDAYEQFGGSGRGRGKSAKTNPKVLLEPIEFVKMKSEEGVFMRIELRLWCRNKEIASSWLSFVQDGAKLHIEEHKCYFSPVFVLYKDLRRKILFEKQQNPNGPDVTVCVTSIPSVEDPTMLQTWDAQSQTVAVVEIVMCLFQAARNDTLESWKLERS